MRKHPRKILLTSFWNIGEISGYKTDRDHGINEAGLTAHYDYIINTRAKPNSAALTKLIFYFFSILERTEAQTVRLLVNPPPHQVISTQHFVSSKMYRSGSKPERRKQERKRYDDDAIILGRRGHFILN